MLRLQEKQTDINNLTWEEMLNYFVIMSNLDKDSRYDDMLKELEWDKNLQESYKQIFLKKILKYYKKNQKVCWKN